MKFFQYVTSLLFMFLLTTSHAHDFFNSSDWCPENEVVQFVDKVDINKNELDIMATNGVICSIPVTDPNLYLDSSSHRMIIDYITPIISLEEQQGTTGLTDPNGGINNQHGILDLPAIAYSYCACSSLNGDIRIDPSTVRPRIDSIDFDLLDHHEDTALSNGMYFSCHVCLPATQVNND